MSRSHRSKCAAAGGLFLLAFVLAVINLPSWGFAARAEAQDRQGERLRDGESARRFGMHPLKYDAKSRLTHVYDGPDRPLQVSASLGAVANAPGGLFRRTANVGPFSELGVPMQMRYVRAAAREGGVGLKGVKVRIVRDPELVGSGLRGYTHPGGKAIDLYPDAFATREQLIRTLGHERTHVYQMRTFGGPSTTKEAGAFEEAAYATESQWWDFAQSGFG